MEIKTCPFCGEESHMAEVPNDGFTAWYVECMNPDCQAGSRVCYSKDDAIRRWNRRLIEQGSETSKEQ